MYSNGLLAGGGYDDLRSRMARCGGAEKFWSFGSKLPYVPPYRRRNGCHFGTSWCFWKCCRNAPAMLSGMLWCCHAAIIAAAVYLAGQLLSSFLGHTCADANHACHRHDCRLQRACECQCRADLLISIDRVGRGKLAGLIKGKLRAKYMRARDKL